MKNWTFILSSLFFLAACGGGGGGGNNNTAANSGTVATTGLTTSCLTGTVNCNNGVYGQYSQYGWQTYPGNPYLVQGGIQSYFYQNSYRFCECPVGTQPAYNGSLGLGCVQTSMVPQAAFQWNLGVNLSWSFRRGFRGGSTHRRIHRDQATGFRGGENCYSGLAQSCYINQPGSCVNGGSCLATSAGSPLGLCANPQQGYNQPGYSQNLNQPELNQNNGSINDGNDNGNQPVQPVNRGGGSIGR